MPHMPKPFFRTARNAWYVQLGTQQIRLHDGPKTSATEKAAWSRYHELMAERGQAKSATPTSKSTNSADGLSVPILCDKFLDWCKLHRSPRTFDGYLWHLQRFLDALPGSARLSATSLKPFHVIEWLDKHPEWGPTYRRNAIASIKRVYVWGEELGYIDSNPIRKIRKPSAARREQVITPEDWAKIRDHYAECDPFRDLLEFAWETGCRPMEVKRIEPRHVDLARHRVVFPPQEAKGKKKARVIYLTSRAEEVLSRRLAGCKAGPVFVNADGVLWTASAMSCRFGRLKKHLGVKYATYSIRHSFCQRKLEDGIDHVTVAALMGHADASMVSKVYSHMSNADEYLRQQLLKGESKN